MSDQLSTCDIDELSERMRFLVSDLDSLLKEVGPILEKVGRRREEISVIAEELRSRSADG